MSPNASNSRKFRKVSGIRLRPELVEALPPSAWTTHVAQVMEPVTLTIDSRSDLLAAMRFFVDRGVHAAAVVGDRGEAVGVLSKTDVLGELCDEPGNARGLPRVAGSQVAAELDARAARRVQDIMTPLTVAVGETTALAHAIAVMARSGVHPVPVMSAEGSVIGIVSSADVIRWLASSGIYREL